MNQIKHPHQPPYHFDSNTGADMIISGTHADLGGIYIFSRAERGFCPFSALETRLIPHNDRILQGLLTPKSL